MQESNQDQLKDAMTWLGEQKDVLFIGQGVGCLGTRLSASFDGVPKEKRIEFPVAEQLQLGVAIGLALENYVPVSVFPRINFLLCAMDQLVNHLDKLPVYSGYRPKVIIRTAVGSKRPLDAGPQHTGDYTVAIESILDRVKVRRLWHSIHHITRSALPLSVYQAAYDCPDSTLIVER